ncbi:hypothetical protein CO110_06030 [Candidatus Desantisbacteria bacterium CG_4_9_14_3_um_filter_40_11]|uniref:FlgD Ig-like domain-containing protein n=3 Tax=unclassified Candidatus Desantisiibacteriota TaxID=3106372 RepID=A0A2M7JC30_9BACT|nr:MAG: hypothetical protein COX18_06030 [Candidatus Desantisbacteria bacterium CG23_combo_of_CG06-09_8_20_14_all_40_23]PIX16985.1 MAG: hypothetical protein COZ71_05705 [Candidatus Desantisbacteria bacterium CG_4_8_14_3_um_filter_40_12]PJB29391.1 MAG: hypothetical protein CO110_06030 [Candidatus Desantisbacteria bacterium CG_4_9_14_3_um_filter_40_11]
MRFIRYSILVTILLTCVGWESCSEAPYIIPYEEGAADKKEIQEILLILAKSIESDEPISIYRIEGCFLPFYEASKDELTQNVIKKELIPNDYLDISSTYFNFFKKYKDISFDLIKDIDISIKDNETTATVSYNFKAFPEGTETENLNMVRNDIFLFKRPAGNWKIWKWTAGFYIGTETTKTKTIFRANNFISTLAYPNPFYPTTLHIGKKIKFPYLTGYVKIKIFNIAGEIVYKFEGDANVQEIEWNGKNLEGELVSSGIYIYSIINEKNKSFTGKIGVIR